MFKTKEDNNFRSIRLLLVRMLSLGSIIAISISMFILLVYSIYNDREHDLNALRDLTKVFEKDLVPSLKTGESLNIITSLKALRLYDDIEGALILDKNGEILYYYIHDGISQHTILSALQDVEKVSSTHLFEENINFSNVVIAKAILVNGDFIGGFYIIKSIETLKKNLRNQLGVQLFSSLIAIVIMFFLSFKLQKRFTDPILELKAAMEEVQESKNYNVVITRNQNDEFKALNNGFSSMLEEIKSQHLKLEQLSSKLSKYLSPQIYESIFTGNQNLDISSSRKKLTVFFSDIVNFTATTESLESEELTEMLNDYLTQMSEIALDHGATIDKYIGDAIVVFFGDPEQKGIKKMLYYAFKWQW